MKPRLLTVAIAMILPSCNNAINSHPDYKYCFVSSSIVQRYYHIKDYHISEYADNICLDLTLFTSGKNLRFCDSNLKFTMTYDYEESRGFAIE